MDKSVFTDTGNPRCKLCGGLLYGGEITEEPKGICDSCAISPPEKVSLDERSRAALDYLNNKLF